MRRWYEEPRRQCPVAIDRPGEAEDEKRNIAITAAFRGPKVPFELVP